MRPSFPIPIASPESYVHREFLEQRDGLQAIPLKERTYWDFRKRHLYLFCPPAWPKEYRNES